MKVLIEIPKEFEKHFNTDRFEDSFSRITVDIACSDKTLSGLYEVETLKMLKKAFSEGEILIG